MDVIRRVFDFKRGSVTMTFAPSGGDESVLIDHSGPLYMSVDEAHSFQATLIDFLAIARTNPAGIPSQKLPDDFTVTPKFSPTTPPMAPDTQL